MVISDKIPKDLKARISRINDFRILYQIRKCCKERERELAIKVLFNNKNEHPNLVDLLHTGPVKFTELHKRLNIDPMSNDALLLDMALQRLSNMGFIRMTERHIVWIGPPDIKESE